MARLLSTSTFGLGVGEPFVGGQAWPGHGGMSVASPGSLFPGCWGHAVHPSSTDPNCLWTCLLHVSWEHEGPRSRTRVPGQGRCSPAPCADD